MAKTKEELLAEYESLFTDLVCYGHCEMREGLAQEMLDAGLFEFTSDTNPEAAAYLTRLFRG